MNKRYFLLFVPFSLVVLLVGSLRKPMPNFSLFLLSLAGLILFLLVMAMILFLFTGGLRPLVKVLSNDIPNMDHVSKGEPMQLELFPDLWKSPV